MSFYIYKLVEPIILPNTSISLSATKLSAISHLLSAISYKLSAIRYFYQTEPKIQPIRMILFNP